MQRGAAPAENCRSADIAGPCPLPQSPPPEGRGRGGLQGLGEVAMRPTSPGNPPLTGQLRSNFEKLHGIGGAELHPNGRCQPLVAVGGKVAVEIVEPGFKR